MHLTIIKIKKKIIKNNLSLSLSHNTHTYVKMLSKSILLKKKKKLILIDLKMNNDVKFKKVFILKNIIV